MLGIYFSREEVILFKKIQSQESRQYDREFYNLGFIALHSIIP